VQYSFSYCSAKMFQGSLTHLQTSSTEFLPFERNFLREVRTCSLIFLFSCPIKRMQCLISDKTFNHHRLCFWKTILIKCYSKHKQVSDSISNYYVSKPFTTVSLFSNAITIPEHCKY
jgi:hypothetical protein